MTITVITRYAASCNACGRELDDDESGGRLDFPDADSATEYAIDGRGWTVHGEDLICTSQDERHLSLKEPSESIAPSCGSRIPASTARNLGADPATTCARVPNHPEVAHKDAVDDVMWVDRKSAEGQGSDR
jgi:hypothetical protein